MDCRCFLYDSSRKCVLNFSLIIMEDGAAIQGVIGAPWYQPRKSFAMILLPADYGLNRKPFDIVQPVMIMVKAAQINKLQ